MHIELQEHEKTLELFQKAEATDWEGLVAKHRLQLTAEFFGHVENLIHAAHQDEAQREGTISWHSTAQQCLCCYLLLECACFPMSELTFRLCVVCHLGTELTQCQVSAALASGTTLHRKLLRWLRALHLSCRTYHADNSADCTGASF